MLVGDTGDPSAVEALARAAVERLGGIDVWVNNAARLFVKRLVETSDEEWHGLLAANLHGYFYGCRAAAARMVEQGTGAILNVASTAAFQPLPGFATYAASKAFVQSFSEAVHAELAGTGVSVTCLLPGFTHTEFPENAEAGEKQHTIPEFFWMEAPEVARVGIDAMVAGRRTAIPGLRNRATMLGGRLVPRSVLLPLVRQVTGRR
jgi:short-subunit dehydrogenase